MFAQLPLWSPLTFFERVGRAVTDFGLGSLVGKYEEYFGRGVTRVLLIIVGLAVVAAGIGAIWQWLISPLMAFFNTPLWGRTLISLVWRGAGIGAGVAVGLLLTRAINEWRKAQKIDAVLERANALMDRTTAVTDQRRTEMGEMMESAKAITVESREVRRKSADVMEITLLTARDALAENQKLTAEERAKFEVTLNEFEQTIKDFRGDDELG